MAQHIRAHVAVDFRLIGLLEQERFAARLVVVVVIVSLLEALMIATVVRCDITIIVVIVVQ